MHTCFTSWQINDCKSNESQSCEGTSSPVSCDSRLNAPPPRTPAPPRVLTYSRLCLSWLSLWHSTTPRDQTAILNKKPPSPLFSIDARSFQTHPVIPVGPKSQKRKKKAGQRFQLNALNISSLTYIPTYSFESSWNDGLLVCPLNVFAPFAKDLVLVNVYLQAACYASWAVLL